jgi:eukaryotic-like serine/threonine-protein kinase
MDEAERSLWREADAVLERLLDVPSGERAAALAGMALPAELQARVSALLAADEEFSSPVDGNWLEHVDAAARTTAEDDVAQDPTPDPLIGRVVGAFRLVECIGRGGMSVVYRADRCDGRFEQQVAVKLLHWHQLGGGGADRFRREQQILARLRHPHIAALFDGGVGDEGTPYLVMELIDGEPIDRYCERRGLSVPRRIGLVRQVCQAVAYAHRQLVVHRDIKPSNILVDDSGCVKLLDFGIAKMLDPAGSGETRPLTRTGVRPQTPEYASPEQVRGEPVTTASDVYQLGLLLYELLTGRRPFAGRGAELEVAITGGRVTRPSEATMGWAGRSATPVEASGSGHHESGQRSAPRGEARAASSPEDIARTRGTTPEGLTRALRGDVDTIVLMALRTEPEQRYGSAEALADDLLRHLDGKPVAARPDTLTYRSAKLLRRHRWAAPTLAAGLVLLLVYVATLLSYTASLEGERDRAEQAAALAEREAATAREVTGFLTGLFRSANPYEALQDTISVAGILERGTVRIRSELGGQPLVRADLLGALADAYSGLGRFEAADTLLLEAIAVLRAEGVAEDDDRMLRTLMEIGSNQFAARDFAAADTVFRRVLSLRAIQPLTPDTAMARLLSVLGSVRSELGQSDSAVVLTSQAVALHRAAGDTTGAAYINAMAHLGPALRAAGAFDSASAVYRELLRRQTELYGPDDSRLATTNNNLAYLFVAGGDDLTATTYYREALRILRAVVGEGHPQTIMVGNNLAGSLEGIGALDEVEALARQLIPAVEAQWPDGHIRVGSQYGALGRFFFRHGRFGEAVPHLETAARIYTGAIGADHHSTLAAGTSHGVALLLAGRVAEAEAVLRPAYERMLPLAGTFSPDVRHGLSEAADALEANGHAERAARYRRLLDPE